MTEIKTALNNPTIEEIKNKYKKYISNIEWDTKINERKGKAKDLNDEQIKYYREFLDDLRTLQEKKKGSKKILAGIRFVTKKLSLI